MAKKVYDFDANSKEFSKVVVNFPAQQLLPEAGAVIEGSVSPSLPLLESFFPHLIGFRKELNSKLRLSSGTDVIPQSGSDFNLKVTLLNLNLGFGGFNNLKVKFIALDYVTLNSPDTITIPILANGSQKSVTFAFHAVHSNQTGSGNPPEHIGDIKVTGYFESLPWVEKNYPVWVNITPL